MSWREWPKATSDLNYVSCHGRPPSQYSRGANAASAPPFSPPPRCAMHCPYFSLKQGLACAALASLNTLGYVPHLVISSEGGASSAARCEVCVCTWHAQLYQTLLWRTFPIHSQNHMWGRWRKIPSSPHTSGARSSSYTRLNYPAHLERRILARNADPADPRPWPHVCDLPPPCADSIQVESTVAQEGKARARRLAHFRHRLPRLLREEPIISSQWLKRHGLRHTSRPVDTGREPHL